MTVFSHCLFNVGRDISFLDTAATPLQGCKQGTTPSSDNRTPQTSNLHHLFPDIGFAKSVLGYQFHSTQGDSLVGIVEGATRFRKEPPFRPLPQSDDRV